MRKTLTQAVATAPRKVAREPRDKSNIISSRLKRAKKPLPKIKKVLLQANLGDKLKRGGKKIKKMTKLEETSPVANPELSKEVYQKVLQQISDAFDN